MAEMSKNYSARAWTRVLAQGHGLGLAEGTGETLVYKTEAKPNSEARALLPGLCASIGRAIEETALVFGDRRLSKKDTFARLGIRGAVKIGVVIAEPSYTCPFCAKAWTVQDMRAQLTDLRAYAFSDPDRKIWFLKRPDVVAWLLPDPV